MGNPRTCTDHQGPNDDYHGPRAIGEQTDDHDAALATAGISYTDITPRRRDGGKPPQIVAVLASAGGVTI